MGTQAKFMSQSMALSQWNVFVKAFTAEKAEGRGAGGFSPAGLLNCNLLQISMIKMC